MKNRSNRSLSSVKSLAPYFQPLRTRHAKSYDFVCHCCGTTLEPEKFVMGILGAMCAAFEVTTQSDIDVREFMEQYEEMRVQGLKLSLPPAR